MTSEEPPSTDLITLTRHVLHDQLRLGPAATGDLTLLLSAIQVTSKFIATNVRRARLINLLLCLFQRNSRRLSSFEEKNRGKNCVVFDPLDGSSNIDAGVNIGTIFGIYKIRSDSIGTIQDVLRPGNEMVAADNHCI
ncbi:hypothetical protein MPER_03848, partial [Moniliophthora perniciosa FA553]